MLYNLSWMFLIYSVKSVKTFSNPVFIARATPWNTFSFATASGHLESCFQLSVFEKNNHIDYCNGLLAAGRASLKYLHEKLQYILDAATRLILQFP